MCDSPTDGVGGGENLNIVNKTVAGGGRFAAIFALIQDSIFTLNPVGVIFYYINASNKIGPF